MGVMPLPGPYWEFHGDRITPFSRIDLDAARHQGFYESLSTMDVELEEAVLVIRGRHQGKEVEFMVGSLGTQGPGNGMVIIHRAEHAELHSGYGLIRTVPTQDEHRLLLDCELQPDKSGHAFTIRMRDEDS